MHMVNWPEDTIYSQESEVEHRNDKKHNGFRQPSKKMLRIVQTFVKPLMNCTSEQLHFENLSLPSDVAMSYR